MDSTNPFLVHVKELSEDPDSQLTFKLSWKVDAW